MGYKLTAASSTAARLYRAVMEYELNGVTHQLGVGSVHVTPAGASAS